jgi:hypothetical protein
LRTVSPHDHSVARTTAALEKIRLEEQVHRVLLLAITGEKKKNEGVEEDEKVVGWPL